MAEAPSLAGPLARIDRADELTLQLTACCQAFLATRPYTVEEAPDENPATRAFLITALRDVPLLPRIIAGEIAHHLRASLDLMVYQMMLKTGVTDEKQLRKSTFPVLDKDRSTVQGSAAYRNAIKTAIGLLPMVDVILQYGRSVVAGSPPWQVIAQSSPNGDKLHSQPSTMLLELLIVFGYCWADPNALTRSSQPIYRSYNFGLIFFRARGRKSRFLFHKHRVNAEFDTPAEISRLGVLQYEH
jgi:hypothetical protein